MIIWFYTTKQIFFGLGNNVVLKFDFNKKKLGKLIYCAKSKKPTIKNDQ